MLAYLGVRNLGVLREAVIEPGEGLTVITGETGTGKTLLLGALRLLLGEKPKSSIVGPFGEETRVDGLFVANGDELGVARRVPRSGRSQAFLEGSIVSSGVLTKRVGPLVEIAGQHDHVALRKSSAVLSMIDSLVAETDPGSLDTYRLAWRDYRSLLELRAEMGGDRTVLEREADLARYQAEEIEAASLGDLDDAAVESMASRIRNFEAIRDTVTVAFESLEMMSGPAGDLVSSVRRLAEMDSSLEESRGVAETTAESIAELRRVIEDFWDQAVNDQEGADALESWLNQVNDLKRKYGSTVEEVRRYGVDQAERASHLHDMLRAASTVDRDLGTAEGSLRVAGSALSATRQAVGRDWVAVAGRHLADLGLASAEMQLLWEDRDPAPSGLDRVKLMFASDSRLQQGAIGDVASGGELSRLVLALRLASRGDSHNTMVFDEVDAGIGGKTALALGEKLGELGRGGQVIAVTHLPQLAAHAERHYVVDRADEEAMVRLVEGEDRITELSRMLAGLPESEIGREAASELLEAAGR